MTSPLGVQPYGFTDAPDYIEKITYAIWNRPERDPELISRYYGPDSPIHMDSGDLRGADPVIANTHARLQAFPDFHGVIDDTIWTGDETNGYRTSMRWTWTATNTGPSPFGPATLRPVCFSAIANCVVRGEVIVEEWLGTNPLSLARQLGFNAATTLASHTPPPPGTTGTRPTWTPDVSGPGLVVTEAWDAAFNAGAPARMSAIHAPNSTVRVGADRELQGPDAVTAWAAGWQKAAPGLIWSLDDQYWLPGQDGDPDRVASQWTLQNEDIRICGISHHHVSHGRIVAEWTHYDELALLAQGVTELP
ncbi:ester cyclase [Streptomyces sp. NPDC001661]